MNILTFTAIIAAIILVMLLIEITIKSTKIPFNVFLVLAGFTGSEIALLFVDDLGIRWFHISDLMLYLLVPIILFQTIFKLNFKVKIKALLPMLLLAFPLSLATGVGIGFVLYFLIDNPDGFPLHSAMVAGMLLASTSPTAMGFLLKSAKAPEQLRSIMMGEGLFNGLIALMLFFFLLSLDDIAMTSLESFVSLSAAFLYHISLGAFAGLLIGWLTVQIIQRSAAGFRHLVLTQIACFLSYFISSNLLGVSGIASLLPTALFIVIYIQKQEDRIDFTFTRTAWDNKRYLASGGLHILMGISLTFALFSQQWLAMLIGIIAALGVRAFVVFGMLFNIRKFFAKTSLNNSYCTVLWWGGMRGGTTIALALSLPETLTGWWTIQAIAYGAVLFSLSFQAGFLPFLVKRANYMNPSH